MHEPDRAGGALKASFVVGNVNHLHDVAIADRTTALPAQGRTQQPGQVFGPVTTGTIAVLLLRSDLTVAASRRHYSGEEKPLSFGQRGGRHTATGSRVRLLRGAWHRRLERGCAGRCNWCFCTAATIATRDHARARCSRVASGNIRTDVYTVRTVRVFVVRQRTARIWFRLPSAAL